MDTSKNSTEVRPDLRVFDSPDSLATAAAEFVADLARRTVARTGTFHVAVSGGTTPTAMLARLATLDVPWAATVVYQVDERVVPIDDPERNLASLRSQLALAHPVIEAMGVDDDDLIGATASYEARLPARFDLVHLGLGPEGHTASLFPGDEVLEERRRLVALTEVHHGHRRMTLTFPALARADRVLWLVAGAQKRRALTMLLDANPSIPASRVPAGRAVIMADRAAQ